MAQNGGPAPAAFNIPHPPNLQEPPPFAEFGPVSNLGTITTPRALVWLFRDDQNQVAGRVSIDGLPSTFWVRYPPVPANVAQVEIDVPLAGDTFMQVTTFNPPAVISEHVQPPLWFRRFTCPRWEVLYPA